MESKSLPRLRTKPRPGQANYLCCNELLHKSHAVRQAQRVLAPRQAVLSVCVKPGANRLVRVGARPITFTLCAALPCCLALPACPAASGFPFPGRWQGLEGVRYVNKARGLAVAALGASGAAAALLPRTASPAEEPHPAPRCHLTLRANSTRGDSDQRQQAVSIRGAARKQASRRAEAQHAGSSSAPRRTLLPDSPPRRWEAALWCAAAGPRAALLGAPAHRRCLPARAAARACCAAPAGAAPAAPCVAPSTPTAAGSLRLLPLLMLMLPVSRLQAQTSPGRGPSGGLPA